MAKNNLIFTFGVPWEEAYGAAQAVSSSPFVYISGQCPQDEQGNVVGAGDFELQLRTAFANLDRVLAHYNATREQVVETTVLIRELSGHWDTVARLHTEYFGDYCPAGTAMGVPSLALPGQLVELSAVVRMPDKSRPEWPINL